MSARVWAIAEPEGGASPRVSAEVATLARRIADASGREAVGVAVATDPSRIAELLAGYLPRVVAIDAPEAATRPWAAVAASIVAAIASGEEATWILVAGTPDGRDLAGMLAALLDVGVLVNATGATWDAEGGLVVEASVLGGRHFTSSSFTGDRGIVVLRPSEVEAEPAATPGVIERPALTSAALPAVMHVEHRSSAGGVAPIEEARIIVSGGRGVGGPEGFVIVEELAAALGGSVGATRAAVDAGWIPYARQIGQTGKTVKPALYVALGVSGALQHKVGMQSAGTIVAVNRDPDAPLAEYADLYVVGDLFEVVPALVAELRARRG
jgi:electron transfer flavoprotein alpha subunit